LLRLLLRRGLELLRQLVSLLIVLLLLLLLLSASEMTISGRTRVRIRNKFTFARRSSRPISRPISLLTLPTHSGLVVGDGGSMRGPRLLGCRSARTGLDLLRLGFVGSSSLSVRPSPSLRFMGPRSGFGFRTNPQLGLCPRLGLCLCARLGLCLCAHGSLGIPGLGLSTGFGLGLSLRASSSLGLRFGF
jgi:hypothetical protein